MRTRNRSTTCHGVLSVTLLCLLCVFPSQAQDHDRKILKKVDAQYPSVLKSRGIGGTVRLRVAVRADGTVKDVDILGGNPSLADAAEKAVRQWRFAPGADSTITVAVNFDPNS